MTSSNLPDPSNPAPQEPGSGLSRGQKWLPIAFGAALAVLLGIGAMTWMESISKSPQSPPEVTAKVVPSALPSVAAAPSATPSAAVSVTASTSPQPQASAAPKIDLSVNSDGLSKAMITMTTTAGVIKFKFYTQDAPNTVNRLVELIQKGFYNGLTFHRVVPGFIIQGGDPTGTGTGGSGQKLKAEFNSRHHLEGTLAMARTSDPDSADSQFYIALAPEPSLDHNYTVFGQVVDGLPVIHNIKVGDKITSMTIE